MLPAKLIRRASNLELPVRALAAIVELRAEIDRLEAEVIRSARAKGAAWDDIAAAAGVTRQALQHRHRERLNPRAHL